jgi:hypothetical protein
MEGILLGSGAYATGLPIVLGLLVLGFGITGIALGHASDAEASGRRATWAEWPVTEAKKPMPPEEEKVHVRKAA